MTLYCIQISPLFSLSEAWEKLEEQGFSILYGEEIESTIQFYIELSDPYSLSAFEWITSYQETQLPSIDWEAQWTLHGHDFREGYVHVQLSNDLELKLQPGPGFGDLSHPTTALMLELLKNYQQNQAVVDIGCGSGILSIAAALLKPCQVYGIDIDEEAIKHSQMNAQLNQVEDHCHFVLPNAFTVSISNSSYLILMNMIQSEQEVAWESLPSLHHCQGLIITSGIRLEERESYLILAKKRNWHLKEEKQKEGWLAFCFKIVN